MRSVIGAHIEEMHAALAVPPQTNEVGRSAALLAGLFDLVAASGVRRIRLLELGASAGLNLLLDYYGFRGTSWHFGSVDSKVQFVDPIEGPLQAERFMIMNRAGCDLHPVDATTAEGRVLLTSFVWPFDLHRHERLSSALAVAAMDASSARRQGRGKQLVAQGAGDQLGWSAGCLALDHTDVLANRGSHGRREHPDELRRTAAAG